MNSWVPKVGTPGQLRWRVGTPSTIDYRELQRPESQNQFGDNLACNTIIMYGNLEVHQWMFLVSSKVGPLTQSSKRKF